MFLPPGLLPSPSDLLLHGLPVADGSATPAQRWPAGLVALRETAALRGPQRSAREGGFHQNRSPRLLAGLDDMHFYIFAHLTHYLLTVVYESHVIQKIKTASLERQIHKGKPDERDQWDLNNDPFYGSSDPYFVWCSSDSLVLLTGSFRTCVTPGGCWPRWRSSAGSTG